MRRTLAVGLLLLAACGGEKEPDGIQQESNRTEAQVVVKVAGAERIEFSGPTTIIIYRTLDERVPLGLRLFSVGIPAPHIAYAAGASFRAAFDVLGFKGDGTYAIPKTIIGSPVPGPSGLPLPSGIQSNAFVEEFRPAADPPVTRYDVALEPCLVQTSHGTLRGSVACPRLKSDRDASTVSLDMSWDAV